MKKPLIVRPEAEGDLAEAYQWYEQQVHGGDSNFTQKLRDSEFDLSP